LQRSHVLLSGPYDHGDHLGFRDITVRPVAGPAHSFGDAVAVAHGDVVVGIEGAGDHGVELKTEVTLAEITPASAVVVDKRGKRAEILVDSVVLALGMTSLSNEVRSLQRLAPESHIIGDCRSPGNLMAAIHDGFNVTADL
jgi:hypothetical protein